ncbi:15600_t:CDS:10 [Cetraspora pellucida]|uniref:15600_t:CDS:1 n=1 Tax=Cetraspora pellucida TaxID=1433469 RepID=A0A9N8WIF8_9GLOM|nr:15600_t:CDS:10 [Cetraspora pellucida]
MELNSSMERLEALAVLDKFAATRQKKFVSTLPIIRGVNDGSSSDKELIPIVETEIVPEGHDQHVAEIVRQHIDYPSPPVDCNSFFTRDAYEKYSFYSFRRTCEIFSMQQEKKDISVQKPDNVIDKSQINEQITSPIKSDDDLIMDDQCSEEESYEIKTKPKITVQSESIKVISEKRAEEVISEKRAEEVESQESVDVIGPFLQLLDQQRKQLEKSNAIRNVNNSAPVSPVTDRRASNVSDTSSTSTTFKTHFSSMSEEEHLKYLQLKTLATTSPTLISEQDRNFLLNMNERIQKEREEYIKWQYDRAQTRLSFLNQNIADHHHLTFGRQHVIKEYPRFYELMFTIGLALPPPGPGEPTLKFKQTIKATGTCYNFSLQPLSKPIPISRVKEYWIHDKVSDTINASNSTDLLNSSNLKEDVENDKSKTKISDNDNDGKKTVPPADYWQKMCMPAVSKDPLIQSMVTQHKVDIVISSSGLCALVSLQASSDVELEIPICVTESEAENSILKTIYIDKPLVKKRLTPRQRNQLFYDVAFESLALKQGIDIKNVLHPSEESSYDGPMNEGIIDTNNSEKSSDIHSGNSLYNLWSFGDINMLIRCKAHGFIQEPDTDKKIRIVGIKTKLEYQLDVGYEDITNLERARWWIYTFIRNNAHLMLGRVNVLNNELWTIEKKRMADIIPDGNWPRPHSKMLHYILKKLQSLPKGSYLFSHLKGEPHATVTTHLYDLHKAHSQSPLLDLETIPFIPMQWNGPPNQIPSTFPIRPTDKRPFYCFEFLRTGNCSNLDCSFPHLTREECEDTGVVTNYCFVFADTGRCDNRNDELDMQKSSVPSKHKTPSAPKKSSKKKKSNTADDLLYIANNIIAPDLDDMSVIENKESSAKPDFDALLKGFNQ